MAMAATSGAIPKEALNKLDQHLLCDICLERYTDPRTLPCHHSFCKNCISCLPVEPMELDNGQRVVKCPNCRNPTHLGENGVNDLPTAFHINNLLDIDQLLPRRTSASESIQQCQTHGNKLMDLYCETCEQLICFKCSTESHHDHHCDYAVDLFPQHKLQIEDGLQLLQQQIVAVKEMLAHYHIREREIKEQGEAVQNEIDQTYQRLKSKLRESRNNLSQEAAATLQEKLQLHSLQRANVTTILVQLESCHKYMEEKLESQSQYQIQAVKKQIIKQINSAHSDVKINDLQPAQELNTTFTADKSTLSACSHIGEISNKHSLSSPGLFLVDFPPLVVATKQAKVSVSSSIPLAANRISYELTPLTSYNFRSPVVCPVTSDDVKVSQFKVMFKSSTAGPHQLRVLVDGVDIYGSPFSVCVSKWKTGVRFAKGIRSPMSIAVTDDEQHLVVSECNSHRVVVLSSTGKVVERLGSQSSGFSKPWGVAVSADKHIFVAVSGELLRKYDFSLSSIKASCDIHCGGVAVHPTSGKVYCTNRTQCNITVLNNDLTHSHSFGHDYITNPMDVAIDSKGMVYVVECDKGVVLKFTPDGKYLATIGSKGDQPHQFHCPFSICIGSDDIMYVTDSQKREIVIFTAKGDFIAGLSFLGQSLCGIAVDKIGNLYLSDGSNVLLFSKVW